MKKFLIFMCIFSLISSSAIAAAGSSTNEGIQNPPPPSAEMIKERKAREAAFEKKLGLTEEQISKARELRIQGHKEMKPVMDKLFAKKKEVETIKLSRMAVQAQEEKLTALDKEIAVLEKQADSLRKKNMKDFESILTSKQKKILKQMKQEGRQKFEQKH